MKFKKKSIKYLLILILILILYIKNNKNKISKKNITSDKWIVMATFNPPELSLINILNNIGYFNMIIISCDESIENKWMNLKLSDKIIFLSIKEQKKLDYKIIKYLEINSYSRKNIGYLYAISHGAREIYEIDEDIFISNFNSLIKEKNKICYGINIFTKMINPYSFFGQKKIWPRGFRINDIGKQYYNNFYLINDIHQIILKPLIIQGLINENPDIDSILYQTKINKNGRINFYNYYPLIYLPGNYVPINSKNTIYSYQVFPFLFLPSSASREISDILRGYILQRFAWGYNGMVMYCYSDVFRKHKHINNFIKEKSLYYKLDTLLDALNLESNTRTSNSSELLMDIIIILIDKGFIDKKDFKICEVFLQDLFNLGYYNNFKFIKQINYKYKEYLKLKSEFYLYIPQIPLLKFRNEANNNIKIINHFFSNKTYDNILLIINYNHKGFYIKLNNYILSLYEKYFKNIVFIIPDNCNNTIKNSNYIFCNNSFYGYYSYICFYQAYTKFPNYKGYLFINDDVFVKVWELENLDFKIPWLYNFGRLKKKWFHYKHSINIFKILKENPKWKKKLINIFEDIPIAIADFFYLPNNLAFNFSEIIKTMFKSKIFLECVVPTAFGILSNFKYQYIIFRGLWSENRKKAIDYLRNDYIQITIHPIKFSNRFHIKEVNLYIHFINAKEYNY